MNNNASSSPFLISLRNAAFALGGHTVLSVDAFSIKEGEHWVIMGENGAGKSTLFGILAGDIWPLGANTPPEPRLYGFNVTPTTAPLSAKERIRRVSSEDQERYQRREWRITGMEAVLSGFFNAPVLYQQRPTKFQEDQAWAALDLLNARHLASRQLPTLSQGELRRILVARALAPLARADATTPSLLLLDEVCDGLDPESRSRLLEGLGRIACGQESERYGKVQLVLATHRREELPSGMSHAAILQQGRIIRQGDICEVLTPDKTPEKCTPQITTPQALEKVLQGYAPPHKEGETILSLRDVDIYREGRRVLTDVNFTFTQGQQWGLIGSNGAGKSTFLELISGLLHPSCVRRPAGAIDRCFDQEHMAELRTRIGIVSPRLQATWPYDTTVEELVVSGVDAHIGPYGLPPTEEQLLMARQWLEAVELDALAARDISQLSNGQRRRAFLARAMLAGNGRGPALLLLDEPCSGLDTGSRQSFLAMMDALAAAGVPLLLATHHKDELIPGITHLLRLQEGNILFSGPREQDTGDSA